MDYKITIIVPVYNMERHLRQCLDSCIAQTMRDVQILCIDDGSTDGSPLILEKYAKEDQRIRIHTQPNAGLSAARNTGISRVEGKYLLFVDSDDWIHLDTCQRTYDLAEEYRADFCVFHATRPGKKRRKTSWDKSMDGNDLHALTNLTISEKCKLGLFTNNLSACCKLIRTEFLREHGFIFPKGLVFEDLPFHWDVVRVAQRIVYINDELYYYRQRPDSIMGSRGKHHFDIVPVFDLIKKSLIENGCFDEFRRLFTDYKLSAFRRHYREITPSLRNTMRQRILDSLTESDWEYLLNDPAVNRKFLNFFNELKKDRFSLRTFGWLTFAEFWKMCERFVLWPIINMVGKN